MIVQRNAWSAIRRTRKWSAEIAITILIFAVIVNPPSLNGSRAASALSYGDAINEIPDLLQAPASSAWLAVRAVPIPTGQSEMLQLEASTSRQYRRLGSLPEVQATLFVAEVSDARLMVGHHPPVCYPASGWRLRAPEGQAEFRFERGDGIEVLFKVYRFERSTGSIRDLVVVNGFWDQGGVASSTLDTAISASLNSPTGNIGLAQFQILFQEDYSDADLNQYVAELLDAIPSAVFAATPDHEEAVISDTPEVGNEEARQ